MSDISVAQLLLEGLNCSTFTFTSLQKTVEKDRFLYLLKHQDSLSKEETGEINIIQAEFPYSQVIHNLAARGAQLNGLPNWQSQLNVAAVYSTDRAVLKSFITAPAGVRAEIKSTPEVSPPVKTEQPEKATIEETKPDLSTAKILEPADLHGDELIDEVFHDIERLKKLKHDFELVADGFELPAPVKRAEQPTPKKKEKSRPESEESDTSDGIITEIKNTKKKIKPSDPKQKEQLEIIDQFIKSKPAMPKGDSVKKREPATDLAESSSVFSENIISETLVEILIKQGKKEKAVEVLRKLIWKFPQKKAYFAAQIEELTR